MGIYMKMVFMLLLVLTFTFAVLAAVMYLRTSQIISSMDEMLESAVNHTFSEKNYTETRLSKLESKMYRYLSAGKTAQNRILQERNSLKSIVSDISHQTKQPVSNILLYTQLLKEREDIGKEAAGMLSQMEEQAEKLSFLISSLVKTSRLENGIVTLNQKKNPVGKLLEGIDDTAARRKKVRFCLGEIPECMAVFDPKWTGEALENIVDNAVKYTKEGGKVTLSVKEYEMFICIEVADTGIGMSEEETAKIFTRFYRSPLVSEEKGVGIGLYLAREIITKQGGYIRVASREGEGSVFSVFLPKQPHL